MSVGAFDDKDHPPTSAELLETLGPKQPLWEGITQFIADNYAMPGELSYGGRKYGWNVWYRRSGKTLVTLYPQRRHFVAQIVLGRDQVKAALQLKLGKNVRAILEETPQLHDGRWLFINIRSQKDVKDVEQLLAVKKRPKPGKRS
jgi:hypothetical protein